MNSRIIMNNSLNSPTIVAVALLFCGLPAEAGWNIGKFVDRTTGGKVNASKFVDRATGGKIELDKAVQKAANDSAETVKAAETTGSKSTALTVVKKELAEASETAQNLARVATDQQQRADTLAVQKNTFLLAAVSLVLTNTFTLGGLLSGRSRTKLEVRKLMLDIEERELALKELKRKLAAGDQT
jgi:hypothetical protein